MTARRFKFSSFYSPSYDVQVICWRRHLQLAISTSGGAEHFTLSRNGITQIFSVVENTFLPCQDRLRVRSPEPSQIRFNQRFQRST